MALFRKFFYRKPPDGLFEISDRVYVFNWCFTTDTFVEDKYKGYVGGIVSQLQEQYADAQFLVFNFRDEHTKSQMANILSQYDITIMDYPRHYEGCPLLTMEVIHHFLRSTESWLSLGHHNILIMHCEMGGWPVLAFMLAALLIYRKQYSGEQKTLEMVYKQAPRELLQMLSPLNPLPSQLRYLQYISRRNVGSEWPPLDRALTLDCIILRCIPNFDGEGGCRPIFRIYGQDPFLVADRRTKVLFSTHKKSKIVRFYKQAECELVKIDISCHIQGDVVLECINLHDDMEREGMMFRVVFNTAFIRSNILMLNGDEVDMLWNAKDQFPRDFRAEILFSEMDAASSVIPVDLSCFDEEGLPVEAFSKVHEIFSHVDWLDPRADVAYNVLQHLNVLQDGASSPSRFSIDKIHKILEDNISSSPSTPLKILLSPTSIPDTDSHEEAVLKQKSHPEVGSQKEPKSTSVSQNSAHVSPSEAISGKAQLLDEILHSLTKPGNIPDSAPTVSSTSESSEVKDVSVSPSTPAEVPPIRPSMAPTSTKAIPPPPPPPPPKPSSIDCWPSDLEDDLTGKSASLGMTSSASLSSTSTSTEPAIASSTLPVPPPPPPPPTLPAKTPISDSKSNAPDSPPSPQAGSVAMSKTPQAPIPPPPPPVPPSTQNTSVRAGPPPPPFHGTNSSCSAVTSPGPPPPPPAPGLTSNSSPVPAPPPPAPLGNGLPKPPGGPPSIAPPNGRGRLLRTVNSRSHQAKKLKPLHWLKLSRAVSGSLWAETPKTGDAAKAPEIDMSELESLFSAAVPNADKGAKSNLLTAKSTKPEKVQLIDHRRAYNCEIMLSKVKVPLAELMSSVLTLEDSGMDVDQVENLIKFSPTKEEMEQLKGYTGDKERLGKCEQFLMELMKVPRVEAKLRVFSFKIQFHSQVADLRKSLNIVNSVAEQIRNSGKLKRVMQTILSLGNALNQGTARGSAIGFRLDSLLKLTDTRARNNRMTLMHYLCKVLHDKLPELLDLEKDLDYLEPASKIQLKYLAEEMQALSKGLEKVVQELALAEGDGPVSGNFAQNLKGFLSYAESEVRTLASLYSGVGRNVDALILYFGEDPARCPFEQVISTLLNFVRMFHKAHEENTKQLEQEMKKAVENDKLKKNDSKIDPEQLMQTTLQSSDVK